MAGTHGRSCANRLREAGQERGATVHEIAATITTHCAVSPLRAFRLARALTLKQAADALVQLAENSGDGPRPDAMQLSAWETGQHRPRISTIELLAKLYQCAPGDLGYGIVPAAMSQSAAAQPCPGADADPLGCRVDTARRSVDRTLAAGSVTSTQMDMLDEQIHWALEQYVYTPPQPMINTLLHHLDEVGELARQRQPALTQLRLSELAAVLTTLIADALMKLGQLTRSQAWYATARTAADDTGNRELRARVRVQAAMLPYYYGPTTTAIRLAQEARYICRATPTTTAAFASMAEARALAKHGGIQDALAALHRARDVYSQTDAATTSSSAWDFPLRRFHLYESGTLTALGKLRPARQAQEAALRLYPEDAGIDPALLRLEAAICLARDRDTTEACRLAAATYLRIEAKHRTPIVEERAREVITALPPNSRSTSAVRDLTDVLALPAPR
ncbi:helix-turn-helix domain-containing protein [Streptomyces chumphonensis]|uniref:helix-turn-helix domain-containing protein n=1 Tax=Streptomyces chumphonensis TaxID=1214925 RepID=UPI003D70633B